MQTYLFLPIDFLKFWYREAPEEIIRYFLSFNTAFLQLFSLPLLLRTFFQPLKNEYRQGLIWFSIGMGIGIKTLLILISFLLLSVILIFQIAFLLLFLAWPVVTIVQLFIHF